MNFDDLPEIDLDQEDHPVVDLDAAEGKPRPAPPRPKPRPSKKPRQPVQPLPPPRPVPTAQIKGFMDSILGKDQQSQRLQQVQEATKAYEANQIQYPEPHKFVAKTGPAPIRDLGAEDAQFQQMLTDAQKRIDKEKYEAKLAGRSVPTTAEQLVSHFGRGYAGSMKSMLKGPTLLNKNARTDPTTKFLYQTPQEEEATMQQWFPVNKYDQSFKMRAAEAIGSTVPFMLGGAAADAAGLPGWMMSGVLGASSNASQTYDDAIANGMDEMKARKAAIAGALIGMTEALGLGKMRAPHVELPAFATPLMSRILAAGKEYSKEGIEEWLQEFGSQVLNNVNAKVVMGYDPKRAIQEGVWDAGSLGFLTGFGMAGGMHMIGGSVNARDPEYMAAKKEYVQAMAVDKAFKNFLNTQQLGDPRQIGVRRSGKIATPPQFRTEPLTEPLQGAARIPPPASVPGFRPKSPSERMTPQGRALASGPAMPLHDMGLMTQSGKEEPSIEEFADRLKKAGYDPGDLSQYTDSTDLYLTMLGGIGLDGMNDRQFHISYLFDPTTDNPWVREKNRFEALRPGPPNPQVKPFVQETVGDPNTREDNLLEWLRHSEAFHNSGDPIVGYYASQANTEHGVIPSIYKMATLDEEYGSGIYFYQDPELASERAERRTGNTLSTVQDIHDYPGYEDMVKAEQQRLIQALINEHADMGIPEEALTWGEEGRDKAFLREAKDNVLEKIVDGFIKDKPPNLRPFYMNITKPYDMDRTLTVEEVIKIGEAVRGEYGDEVADSFMNNFNPEDFDERDWAGVTGMAVARKIDELLGRADYYNDEYYSNKLYGPSKVWRVMKRAGYNGLKYKTHEGRVREFKTPEEAEAYADKVGGIVNYKPGVLISPSTVTWGAGGQGAITIPEVVSKGPTVSGSTRWVAWDEGQIKSSTGNTGEFNPNNPEVYRTMSGREGGATTKDDLRFDVIPGLGGETGNAPYMLVPRWVMTAIGEGKSGGFNFSTSRLGEHLKRIRKGAPSDKHADVATKALFDLVDQSLDAGLNSVSIIPHDQTEQGTRGAIEHETFHAATRAGLTPKLGWVMNHPLLREIIDRPIKRVKNGEELTLPSIKDLYYPDLKKDDAIKLLSMEIPAYTVEGRLDILGISPAEGIDFTFDLFNHLRTEYGQEGIDNLKRLARMRPEMVEAFDLAQSMWDDWQEELKSGDRAVNDGDVWYDEMEPFRIGDNVYSPENPEFGVMRTLSDDGESAMVRGPRGIAHMAKKALKKVKGWINTEAGKEVLEQNPLAPSVPEEGPPDEPPPPPPRQPGGGAGDGDKGPSSLFKEHLSPEAVQLLGRTYKAMLEAGGIDGDPLLAPFEQVIAAINDGKLNNVYIDEIMEREGIPVSEFSRSMAETASDAGKVLQVYSEIARFWNSIIDEWEVHEGLDDPKGRPTGGKTGPKIPGANLEAMYRMIPVDVRVQRALRGVRSTALGRSMWQRSGNVTQKAMLTQLSTFATNSITSGGQLPLRLVTYGVGAWMHQMGEGKSSFMQRLKFAHDDMMDAMKASYEVVKALNPWQFAQWAMGQKNSTKFAEYQHIVQQLQTVFPDIKKKLFALSTGTETLQTGKRQLSIAERLVPLVKDQAKREALLADMKVYQERLETNAGAFGKLLNGTEAMYDLCLWPMQWAEYLMRRPMFVGQLRLELQRQGHDLSQLLAQNRLSEITEETMERAVNKALEFTYAYMPGTKTGTDYKVERGVERAAMKAIEWLNQHGGPLNALIGEPFGKAMFNGAKFVYEYSPVGAIFPANKIISNWGKEKTVAELNSQIRFNGPQAHAARAVTMRGVINDPLTGKKTVVNKTNHNDYDRVAKAMVGTLMYTAVAFLRHYYGGPEWWQLDLGEKGADGRPVYFDMRRHKPFATMFQVVDLVERMATGNLGDQDPIAIASEVMTGIRMYDNQMGGNIIQSAADWFRHEDVTTESAYYKGQEEFGQMMAVYITPLINLRDCIAQFSAEENVKKDTRGSYSVMGPVMDKIPYLRRLLPNLTSPVEPSPIPLSKNPAIAQGLGLKKEVGQNFAGREWRRLGLYNNTFLTRLTDPVSNRAQNEFFQEVSGAIGEELEKDPEYQAMDDPNKAALWEDLMRSVAADARKIGKAQNPVEAAKDEVRQSVPGRLRRKAMGLDKELKEIKE